MTGIVEVIIMAKLITIVMAILMIMLVVKIVNLEEDKRILKECLCTANLDALCERDGYKLWMVHKKGNERKITLDLDVLCGI